MTQIATLGMRLLAPGAAAGVHVMRMDHHGATGPHDHLFHELVCILAGSAEHVTVEGVRKLRPGDVIVIRPQIWHSYRNPQSLSLINALFDGRLLYRFGNLLSEVDGALELFGRRARRPGERAPIVLHASPAARAPLVDRLGAMMLEQRQQRPGWQAAVTLGMLEVLLATARLMRHEQPQNSARLPDRSEQAVLDCATWLEAHYADPVRLGALADRVHLSPAHLSRAFARRMGMGIVAFVHCLRTEEACRLLRLTNEPIKAIAMHTGYREIAYFSRCFRQQMNQSPTAYRRALRAQ
jgi:AraC family transcriptional regulator, L-rhamnose operon transcriptional activator RhaR